MTTMDLRSHFVLLMEWILIIQFAIIGVIATGTYVLLVWRRYKRKTLRDYDDYFSDIIIQDLIHQESFTESKLTGYMPPKIQWLKRHAFRRAILNQIEAISGREKTYLIQQYCAVGFAEMDKEMSYSIFWVRRLKAISNLSRLEMKVFAPVFERLRNDSVTLVAGAAIIALSALKHSLNREEILTGIRKRSLKRQNLILRVIENWVNVYGHQFILNILLKEKAPILVRSYVTALAELKEPEVGQVLVKYLVDSGEKLNPVTLLMIVRSLNNIGDPLYVTVAQKFLDHTDAQLRAEALNMVVRLSGVDNVEILKKFQADDSIEVQRVVKLWRERKAQ